MSRLPNDPPAIIQQVKQSQFICVACGAGRDCDCDAPAARRIADIKEQARQRQIRHREKALQDQQPRHVTEPESELQPKETAMRRSTAAAPAWPRELETEAERDEREAAEAKARTMSSAAAIEDAVKHKNEILRLVPSMQPIGREQFLKVLVEDVAALNRKLGDAPF
jgi:hypothetical protein